MRKIAVLFVLVLLLAGCDTGVAKTDRECRQKRSADAYLSEVREGLGEAHLVSAEYRAFEMAFWEGFWDAHEGCEICGGM